MVTTAAGVEWTVVGTEVEALQLEYSWIKEFDPRFNVKYRDDKSYPWLAVTVGEEFPRVMVGRGAKKKGTRYFGPYSHAWAIRDTIDQLLRVFPMRSCSNGVFKRSAQVGRPCLLGYIDKCAAPCVGRVSAEEHRRDRRRLLRLHGRADRRRSCKRIEKEMYAASDGPGLREGRPAPRRPRGAQPGAGEAGRGARRRHRRRRRRARGRPARGRRADLPRPRRPGPRPARLGRGEDRGHRPRRPRGALPPAALRRRVRRGRAEGDPGARPARTTPRRWRPGCRSCGGAGSASGSRSAATRRPCRRPWPATPSSRWRCTRPSAPPT